MTLGGSSRLFRDAKLIDRPYPIHPGGELGHIVEPKQVFRQQFKVLGAQVPNALQCGLIYGSELAEKESDRNRRRGIAPAPFPALLNTLLNTLPYPFSRDSVHVIISHVWKGLFDGTSKIPNRDPVGCGTKVPADRRRELLRLLLVRDPKQGEEVAQPFGKLLFIGAGK
jgi:hypothetical protein